MSPPKFIKPILMTLIKNYLYGIPEAHVAILVYDEIDPKPIFYYFIFFIQYLFIMFSLPLPIAWYLYFISLQSERFIVHWW